MSRKSLVLASAIFVLLAGTVGAALVLLLRHEKDFYHRMAPPPGPQRERDSQEFQAKFLEFMKSIVDKDPEATTSWWEAEFSDREINSYFVEDFVKSNLSQQLLPEGISEPRVAIEANRIRLGFRYGSGPWSSIIAIDFRVWLASKEPNVVAMELQGLHAGGLPISAQSLLERVFEVARRQNIEVSWYRYKGNPVAVLKFQANQPRPTVRLERLELQDGKILVGGRCLESTPLRLLLGPRAAPADGRLALSSAGSAE